MLKKSRLFRRIGAFLTPESSKPSKRSVQERAWRRFALSVESTVRLLSERDVAPLVALIPSDPTRGLAKHVKMHKRISELVRGIGVEWLDLTEDLRGQGAYFARDAHLNPRGHRIVAEQILSALQESGVIP